MDEEMNFPNPVVRTDLPVKKPKWPKILIGLAAIGFLCLVFLPQILHTRIGKRLIRARLESRYNADVAIQDFSTSWFGGTTANQCWIKSGNGGTVGFNALKSEISLWKLLRDKYPLGNCTIDGLIVDYVLDTGDDAHRDSYEKITGALPRAAGAPTSDLAQLSGKITLTNSQFNLSRGKTDPNSLNVVFQNIRFTNVNGEFNIPALDQPWTYKLSGTPGITGLERDQTFESAGTLCLGEGSRLVPSKIAVDAAFTGQGVPTDMVPVLLPLISGEDARAAFGPTFDRLRLTLKGTGGLLKLEISEAASARCQAHLQPTINLNATPMTLAIVSKDPADNLIAAAIPPGPLRSAMANVNPFVMSALGGTAVLRIESLDIPLTKFWTIGTGKAELELHDVKLAVRSAGAGSNESPGLPMQLAEVTGDISAAPELQAMPLPFTMDNGVITLTPSTMAIGQAQVNFSGTGTVDGKLRMKLGVTSRALAAAVTELTADPLLQIPLLGTVDAPRLDFEASLRPLASEPARKVKEWFVTQLLALRSREAEESRRNEEKKVQEKLNGFLPESPAKP